MGRKGRGTDSSRACLASSPIFVTSSEFLRGLMARASSASYCSALVSTFALSLGTMIVPLELRLARGGRLSDLVSEVLTGVAAGLEMVGMMLKSEAVAIYGNAGC